MKQDKENFHTFRGYQLIEKSSNLLSASMEDYLEMLYRLSYTKGYTRVSEIAVALNVQPPSVTSMMRKLAELDYINYEKYGVVELTPSGKEIGEYLLNRHGIIEHFLSIIGVTDNILVETEKIEHNISPWTVERISRLVVLLEKNPDLLKDL